MLISALLCFSALIPQDLAALGKVGSSVAAKRICSGVFLGGRSIESLKSEEFAPETMLDMALSSQIRVELDRAAHKLTVHAFGQQRTALYREGLGCVLLGTVSEEQLLEQDKGVPRSTLELSPNVPWPRGDADALASPDPKVDSKMLANAVEAAFVEPTTGPKGRTRAVIVLHRGKIIAERYAAGYGPTSRLEGWSMTKSVLNALIAIRIGQGELSLEQDHLFPLWSAEGDPRAKLTVDQLLRMSSGLQWGESYTDPTADPLRLLFAEADCVQFASERGLQAQPDAQWYYSSGTSNLLSGVLRASFDSLAEYHAFPREQLFEPLGMGSALIECDPAGNFVGSSFCWATARDWARFGLLYLNDGVLGPGGDKSKSRRLLPEGWVQQTVEPSPNAPLGKYGLHWWLNYGSIDNASQRTYPNLPADMFYANGFEKQIVAVIPPRELVIVRLGCTKAGNAFSMTSFLQGIVGAVEQ